MPLDVDGRQVDAPHDNVLSVGRNRPRQVNIQLLDLVVEGSRIDRVLHPGHEVRIGWLVTVLRQAPSAAGWQRVLVGSIRVGKDGECVGL